MRFGTPSLFTYFVIVLLQVFHCSTIPLGPVNYPKEGVREIISWVFTGQIEGDLISQDARKKRKQWSGNRFRGIA